MSLCDLTYNSFYLSVSYLVSLCNACFSKFTLNRCACFICLSISLCDVGFSYSAFKRRSFVNLSVSLRDICFSNLCFNYGSFEYLCICTSYLSFNDLALEWSKCIKNLRLCMCNINFCKLSFNCGSFVNLSVSLCNVGFSNLCFNYGSFEYLCISLYNVGFSNLCFNYGSFEYLSICASYLSFDDLALERSKCIKNLGLCVCNINFCKLTFNRCAYFVCLSISLSDSGFSNLGFNCGSIEYLRICASYLSFDDLALEWSECIKNLGLCVCNTNFCKLTFNRCAYFVCLFVCTSNI